MVEVVLLLELAAGGLDPAADLARALGRPLAQPALELRHGGRHEDRHGAVDAALDPERPLGLELEEGRLAGCPEPVDLGEERSVPVPHVVDPFEELPRLDPAVELVAGQEVVMHAVFLAGSLRAGGRRDGDGQLRVAGRHARDQRSLAGPGGSGHDEDGLPGGFLRRCASD